LNPKSCIDTSVFLSGMEDQGNPVEEKKIETPYVFPKIGRKHKSKQETEELDVNLNDQSRKKPKKSGNNLENIMQKWVEQQEVRQIELDRRREEKDRKEQEQKTELLHMKHQSDMMLFGFLNNLTNSLNSFHEKPEKPKVNQGKFFFLNSDMHTHEKLILNSDAKIQTPI